MKRAAVARKWTGRDIMSVQADHERRSFQAEVVQILDLMVHSLYGNKEIFLRELISNASDAIDRLRLEQLSQPGEPEVAGPPRILVSYDSKARTITVSDNGIGMSRDDVISDIGTIARSGTHEFLQALTGDQRKDAALIGQFGVGFYSAFIVADRVTLTTRRAGLPASEGVRWESDGKGEYTLETAEQPEQGTTVVLHLREEEDGLLSGYRLRSVIQKYSDHISLPIYLPEEKEEGEGEPEGGDRAQTAVNQAAALWARAKNELKDQDYSEFYKHLTNDFTGPLAWLHSKVEGAYEYTLLLYIPSRAPYDLLFAGPRHGVRLHVRRVFIMDDNGQLLPDYLRFVRGVIDSSDLPLNISREILQSSRAVSNIKSNATKKVLRLLADLAENEPQKYATFWREFGKILKEGIAEDYANRDEIAGLLRFTSTASPADEPSVSLAGYVERMKEGQQKIYFLVAPTLAAAASSPHLEAFREKGVEVLLMGDPVDNWVISSLPEFDGKRFQSVAHGIADLDDPGDDGSAEEKEEASAEYAALIGGLKDALAGQVHDVRISKRLTTSPACIVANDPDIGFSFISHLQGSGLPNQPVLEVNPGHPLVERLNREQDARLADWAQVLYGQAVLTLGARIDKPADFVSRLNDLLLGLTRGDDDPETTA
jgi:molecular chaperone HtpG